MSGRKQALKTICCIRGQRSICVEGDYIPAKYMYVFHLILSMLTGVISTTRKVKIQFDALAREAAGVRIAKGAYSAGTDTISIGAIIGSGRLTKPWDGQKAHCEKEVEEEEHYSCDIACARRSIRDRAS